jgi:hypothetical protein
LSYENISKERCKIIAKAIVEDILKAYPIEQPQKVEQEEEKPTDEEIEKYFTSQHFDNKNGHHYRINKDRIFGAKTMRDGKIKSK